MSIANLKRRLDRVEERGAGSPLRPLPGTVILDVKSMPREERERLKSLLLAATAEGGQLQPAGRAELAQFFKKWPSQG